MKKCKCGCGEPVKGIRSSKLYVDDVHRQWHRRKRAAEGGAKSKPARLEVVGAEPETPEAPDPFDEDAPGWHAWPGDPW